MEMSVIDQARKRFMYLVSIIASVQAIIFLAWDILIPPALAKDTLLNIGTLVVMGIIYLWIRKSSDIKNISRVVTGIVMILLFYFTHTVGNPFIAGIYFPIFPLIAFFLRGKKEGLIWVGIFIAITISYFLAAYFDLVGAPFLPTSDIFTQAVNLLLYISVTFFYVDVEEKSRQLLTNQSQKQEEINKQLSLEIEARKKAEADLRQTTENMKKMNDLMVGRELAMTELKKENEELRKRQ